MPVDPRDVRALVTEIRGALDAYPKEALVEILTYVFKEYVVEGPLPLAASASSLVDVKTELDGMSFAQVVQWLQLNLDVPELALLEVEHNRVQVRAGGRMVPLEAQASRPEPLPVAPQPVVVPPPAATASARPLPVPQTPPTAPRPAAPAAAPPGRPAAPAAAATPAPAPAAGQTQKSATPEEPADSRFSLLEVD